MKTIDAKQCTAIALGRLGENEYTVVRFDVSAWLEEIPGAVIGLYNQRPADDAAYPVAGITVDGGIATWTVTSAELTQTGEGKCELVAIAGEVVAKSAIFRTMVFDALDGSGEAPEPWEEWQQQLIILKNEAEQAAQTATDAAHTAESASESVQNLSVSSTTLTPGSAATVEKTVDPETGAVSLAFGIPEGGDGISPSITVTDITGGHRVTITDATGAHLFDVMDAEGAVQDVKVNGQSVVVDGVANVPIASVDVFGATKIARGKGLYKASDDGIGLYPATDAQVKQGTDNAFAVTSQKSQAVTFYGLAKAAGSDEKNSTLPVGQYTDSAKSAISTMLNGPVSVSGTTPSITAMPGIQYVCGEVSTLDITLPASGCVDVVFTSGSTPTVLTVTPPTGMTVEWANGFDSTALEADTLYEINIKMVGTKCLGVAGSWT